MSSSTSHRWVAVLTLALGAAAAFGALPSAAPGGQVDAQPAAAPGGRGNGPPTTPPGNSGQAERVDRRILEVMDGNRYEHARWGLLATDLRSGRTLQQLAADETIGIGSDTKLFTLAAGLEVLGSDHRFHTPVVADGAVGGDGALDGDLILVAQGDLTLGGRLAADGSIAYTDFDHMDANATGGAILTPQDPLVGLDDLAGQVAASGITSISGDVVIDDRLFETTPLREYFLSPIMVNENVVDLSLVPGQPGEVAEIQWRPHTAAVEVVSEVVTSDDPLAPIEVAAEKVGDVTHVTVTGEVDTDALDAQIPPVRIFQVGDVANLAEEDQPAEIASFGRTLFIEALERAGVTVASETLGPNPAASLPSREVVAGLPEVAVLDSPPFSQYSRLILKVSHNMGADLTAMLVGVANGAPSFVPAMGAMGDVLGDLGLDPDTFALSDASGSRTVASPRTVVELLRIMRDHPEFEVYKDSLPILGVDGSLAYVQTDSPAVGHVFAKTGTTVTLDLTHLRPFVNEKALAGYIEREDGREVAFMVAVENAVIEATIFEDFVPELIEVSDNLAEVSSILWDGHP